MRRISRLTMALFALLTISSYPAAQAEETSHYFSETGHTVAGKFFSYWQQHGGLGVEGYPISDEFSETSDADGKSYTVQYFERAVMELHPENPAPYDVLLTQLGAGRLKAKYPSGISGELADNYRAVNVPETGKVLGDLFGFKSYWEKNGGVAQFGYPLTNEFVEQSDLNGGMYEVQYFERAVFEAHPDLGTANSVLLVQLGTVRYREKYQSPPTSPNPPTNPPANPPANTPAPAQPPSNPPTATPAPEPANGQLTASASVDKPTPRDNSNVTVSGRLTDGQGRGIAGATMHTTWNYKTTTSYCNGGPTSADGTASCTRDISRATYGYTVVINVVFNLADGRSVSTSTSFTPTR